MTVVWLGTLAVYAATIGVQNVPSVAWLLFLPMILQDAWDLARARQVEKLQAKIAAIEDWLSEGEEDEVEIDGNWYDWKWFHGN